MISQRKTQIILALLASSIFLFQSCATIIRGTSQNIPVTSNPSGAKIIVDGEEMGYAPLNLKLKRKKSHVIRIDKQGYNSFQIKITRKGNSLFIPIAILGNVFFWTGLGFLAGKVAGLASGYYEQGMLIWYLPISVAICMDFISGAKYSLSPRELDVTLTKIEGNPQPNFIIIGAKQFQNIKWIRIKCADSGKEEIVNLD